MTKRELCIKACIHAVEKISEENPKQKFICSDENEMCEIEWDKVREWLGNELEYVQFCSSLWSPSSLA